MAEKAKRARGPPGTCFPEETKQHHHDLFSYLQSKPLRPGSPVGQQLWCIRRRGCWGEGPLWVPAGSPRGRAGGQRRRSPRDSGCPVTFLLTSPLAPVSPWCPGGLTAQPLQAPRRAPSPLLWEPAGPLRPRREKAASSRALLWSRLRVCPALSVSSAGFGRSPLGPQGPRGTHSMSGYQARFQTLRDDAC